MKALFLLIIIGGGFYFAYPYYRDWQDKEATNEIYQNLVLPTNAADHYKRHALALAAVCHAQCKYHRSDELYSKIPERNCIKYCICSCNGMITAYAEEFGKATISYPAQVRGAQQTQACFYKYNR